MISRYFTKLFESHLSRPFNCIFLSITPKTLIFRKFFFFSFHLCFTHQTTAAGDEDASDAGKEVSSYGAKDAGVDSAEDSEEFDGTSVGSVSDELPLSVGWKRVFMPPAGVDGFGTASTSSTAMIIRHTVVRNRTGFILNDLIGNLVLNF